VIPRDSKLFKITRKMGCDFVTTIKFWRS